jgi:NADP-dependent 3-hydroxy acid dehydrogenase YdfG
MNQQKICLVTGASSGIGQAIAASLAEDKAHRIVATARRGERLEELKSDNVDILPGDLNDPDFQDSLEDFVIEKYGRCDYLFNCAGMIEAGQIEDIDLDRFTAMLRLNIESTFRLTYKLLKRFKAQEYGHVINISSVLGTKVRPGAGGYSATKFAMEALSESLRMELAGTNIQVSCIEPGLVYTEFHNHWEVHPTKMFGISEPLVGKDIVESVKYIMAQPAHVRIPKLMILPGEHNI